MTRLTRLMTRCPGDDPDAHWAGCTAAGVILEKAMAGIAWNGVQQCLVHPCPYSSSSHLGRVELRRTPRFDDSDLRVAIRLLRCISKVFV